VLKGEKIASYSYHVRRLFLSGRQLGKPSQGGNTNRESHFHFPDGKNYPFRGRNRPLPVEKK